MQNVYLMAVLLSLTTTNASAASLTQKLLKPVIAYQCQSELKESKIWKAASWLMTLEQKQAHQDRICGCVSEHAMNNMNAKDVAQAMLDEEHKNRLVRQAVLNSLKGCISEVIP